MKKNIAVLLLFCLVKFASAQDTAGMSRKGFSLEPSESFGNAATYGHSHITSAFGFGVNYMFNDNLGIVSGFQLKTYSLEVDTVEAPSNPYPYQVSTYNGNDTSIIGGVSSSVEYKSTYLEIPLLLRYVSSKNGKIGFFAEGGLVFGFLINASATGSVSITQYGGTAPNGSNQQYNYNGNTTVTTVTIANQNPDVNSFNTSFHLGMGIFVPLSSKISLVSSVETNLGFSSIGKDDKDFVTLITSSNNVNTGAQSTSYNYNYYDHSGLNNTTAIQTNTVYPSTFSLMFKVGLNIKLDNSK